MADRVVSNDLGFGVLRFQWGDNAEGVETGEFQLPTGIDSVCVVNVSRRLANIFIRNASNCSFKKR